MTIEEFAQEFKVAIEEAENVLICLQKSNDLDTTGSALALAQLIEENQKNISSAKLLQVKLEKTKLGNIQKYTYWPLHDPAPSEKTLFITVDLSSSKQMEEETLKMAKECGKVMRIDHHEAFEDLTLGDEKIEAISLNLPSSSSCCEIIWNLARKMKWKTSPEIGEILFKGLYADSKRFRGEQVSIETFRNVVDMYENGTDCKKALNSISGHSLKELYIVADLIKEMQKEKNMAIINLNPEIIVKHFPRNFMRGKNKRISQTTLLTFPLTIIEDLLNAKIIFYIHYSLICPFDSRRKFLLVVLKEPNPKIESILLEEGFYMNRKRFSRAIYFSQILTLLTKYRDIFSNFSQN